MSESFSRQYELSVKILVIFSSFLFVSIIFGYYWLVMETHSAQNADMINSLVESYYMPDPAENTYNTQEIKFKKIAELMLKADKPFLICNISAAEETPVFWNDPSKNNNPDRLLEYFRKSKAGSFVFSSANSAKKMYFIPDNLIYKMRYYPLFLLISLFLIILLTSYLYYFMRKNEKQSVWITMSKETAHQLGTPLTSLKGWSEYISGLSKKDEALDVIRDGLKEDIEKISLVVNRFSNISSDKDFRMCSTSLILHKAVDYISRRMPLDQNNISIEMKIPEVPQIYANEVLLEWTFENILKNSIEALKNKSSGEITVEQYEEKDRIIIEFSDNGTGIPHNIRKNVFDTGFTTKKRGWGLGLSLSKKVIEQYHKGRLKIKQTGSEGTVIRIELNKYI